MRTLLIAVVILLTLAGCASASDQTTAASDAPAVLHIVATTGMVADIAQNIGGDHVQVQALMGAGVDPIEPASR